MSAAVACASLTATAAISPIADIAAASPASFFGHGPGGGWRWPWEPGPGRGHGRTPAPTPTPAPTATPDPTTAPAGGGTTGGTPNPDCTLIVPDAPLTAAGLATPYRLVATDKAAGACHEADADQSAFVEAAIIDPASGAVSVYHPLVIDDGTRPAAAPVRPVLPRGAVVGVWFGYQANILTLKTRRHHHGVMQLTGGGGGACVNGAPGSPFGQYAYCNAPAFFRTANAAIAAKKLTVPPLGTGKDGQPCPTTRDFAVVDQDQSDNLPTKYLATADGRTAQFSAADAAALPGATVLTNASDNGLVDGRLDPALGCTPFTAPDLSNGGTASAALALNELQAAADQAAPVALVPPNDPMALDNAGKISIAKTNLYRAGVNQPPVNPAVDTGEAYCTNLATIAPARLALDESLLSAAPSPDPAASSLFGFLSDRLAASWTNLGCDVLTGKPAPVIGGTPTAAPTTDPVPVAPTTTAAPATTTEAPPTTDPATDTPSGTTTP